MSYPVGKAYLTTRQSGNIKQRDGNKCILCAPERSYNPDLTFLVHENREDGVDRMRWMRHTGIDPNFGQDQPSNLITLCAAHNSGFDRGYWCIVPCSKDVDALAAHEKQDFVSRESSWSQSLQANPDAPCPPRTVPQPGALSGWYEFVPLSSKCYGMTVGNHKVQIVGQQVLYTIDPDIQGPPNCQYNATSGEMLVQLGDAFSIHAVILSADAALKVVRRLVTPRSRVAEDNLRMLMDLYNTQPERPKAEGEHEH